MNRPDAATPCLALDTEFVWTKTYYARLGLVQVAPSGGFDRGRLSVQAMPFRPRGDAEARAILVDPLRSDPAPFCAALEDPATVKLLHDAHQDVQHLCRWSGAARPRSLFDTRLAAGFCGLPSTLSLARLVEETCGVSLPKTETRTDWCRRPLSPEQLEYAAQDVVYLADAARELLRRADALGTAAWMLEEMDALEDPALYAAPSAEDAWRRLRLPPFVHRDPAALRRVRALAEWRERTAQARDLPRKWIVPDDILVESALRPPASPQALPRRAVPPAFQAGFFETLRACAAEPFALEAQEAAPPRRDPAARREAKDRATAILAEIARRAEPLHVDPALFGSRAEITEYILFPDDPGAPLNRGWRREALGEAVRAMV